mgnify:CR=1 FL=1
MKVLFAVNNDNISETIMKKYQKDYKEILSYKNVYYFNAILKEIQNNKDYDRIVVSEDLEPFANNNYDTIDKFLFEKLERINEETKRTDGTNIEVILLCADRRNKSDEMLTKLFGIGMYNALIGDDRNVDKLCELISTPRTKNEAKIAYKVEGNGGMNQLEEESGVSESEVQNILAHYKRLGKNESKYVDSFNNIVSQYTDAQLKIIIRYLPLHVKAVLEQQSPKYRELSTKSVLGSRRQDTYASKNLRTLQQQQQEKIDVTMLKNEKEKITRPIVIPSELNNEKTVKINQKVIDTEKKMIDLFDEEESEEQEEQEIQETPKKGRGRPRKNPVKTEQDDKPKRGRGRPKKQVEEENDDEDFDIDLFNIDTNEEEKNNDKEDVAEDMDFDLFDLDKEETSKNPEPQEEEEEEQEDIDLFNIQEPEYTEEEEDEEIKEEPIKARQEENQYIEPTEKSSDRLNSLLTNEKKIVSFVGTTKNGTSFVVNNLALTLAEMNISTAILDMTQNRNSYYIFTNNDDRLRSIAENSISNLEQGVAQGIKVEKNLTVYTQIPGEKGKQEDADNILATLMENHDVVLIDADFNTNVEFFDKSHEIYLVQSMDILTIQPLTAFLRNLKTKNILRQEKIKIVINKEQRLRTLTDNLLIGGMASYNDPTMTLMTELFNKDNVRYCKIPFEVQNYIKYLDSLVNCDIYLRGYTKSLLNALHDLAEMVYPLLNKTKYEPKSKQKRRMEFSSETRDTLSKMRKNY